MVPQVDSPSDAPTLDSSQTETLAASGMETVHSLDAPLEPLQRAQRYSFERVLGEGGMGNVLLYRDGHIGRSVALKQIREDHADNAVLKGRFLHEARIQGQLEHPAIVPVYDLGVGPNGQPYFTMKRVKGVSLRDIVDGTEDCADSGDRFSRRKLLTAFGNVCLAIDFAHRRGVLHRDLKPENVMLGDYGEVCVLDWGLAKLFERQEQASVLPVEVPRQGAAMTSPGSMLGTPGYMSPEQVHHDLHLLGPDSDVYSLGAILFELLTRKRLHEGATAEELLQSTLEGASTRMSERAPEAEVPPELEEIVVKATASRPHERYQSARSLHDAVERYLDGERDVERRRELAAGYADAAAAAAGKAGTSSEEIGERREAMRNVGRSLALDPGNRRALDTMVALLTEPPKTLPPEVVAEIDRTRRHHMRWTARLGTVSYGLLWSFLPVALWLGVEDWWTTGGSSPSQPCAAR